MSSPKIRLYHAVAFLSAFLLFQVQPMVSKALLPRFGGSYLVWGAAMVFFQAVLLAGYVHAHFAQKWFGVATYARLHGLLLALSFLFCPFSLLTVGASVHARVPLALSVFGSLLVTVALPAFTLSTTSLLLQRWLAISDLPEKSNPYVLYGASNLGSMLGLLTYPALAEPALDLDTQGTVWWIGFAVLAVMQVLLIPRRQPKGDAAAAVPTSPRPDPAPATPPRRTAAWFVLSAAGCMALLAVTNVITMDVASVPLLWVLPLAAYLLAFVVTFRKRLWCPDWMKGLFSWSLALGILLHTLTQFRLTIPAWLSVPLHLGILFVVCVNCAARLVETRPAQEGELTKFYLILALGGLAGSLVVGWGMPALSRSLVEYPLSFVAAVLGLAVAEGAGGRAVGPAGARWGLRLACAGAILVALLAVPWAAGRWGFGQGNGAPVLMAVVALPVALVLRRLARDAVGLALALAVVTVSIGWTEQLAAGAAHVRTLRNFYGIYKVYDRGDLRYLQHGTTQHGRQYLRGEKVAVPLAYFHPSTPAAGVLHSPAFRFRDIGMIGLGTGALVSYAGAGQRFTVFELDPDNLAVATNYFTYVQSARQKGADVRFVFGDGRVSLQREPASSLDLLMLDAFNSGSIPTHLLTVESLREYFRVLRPSGLLLLHVSNKVLKLEPVVYAGAREVGVQACEKTNAGRADPDAEDTYWMALSRDEAVVRRLTADMGWVRRPVPAAGWPRAWTDRYSNLFAAVFGR